MMYLLFFVFGFFFYVELSFVLSPLPLLSLPAIYFKSVQLLGRTLIENRGAFQVNNLVFISSSEHKEHSHFVD